MESYLEATTTGKGGERCLSGVPEPRSLECSHRCLVSEQVGGVGASHPRAVNGWRQGMSRFTRRTRSTQSMRGLQQRQRKKAGERSRGMRQPSQGQAARLESRMTDGRFKTGHCKSSETRQGFIGVRTELWE